MVKGPVGKIHWKKMLRAVKTVKLGKVTASEIRAEIISAIGKEKIRVLIELCQRVFDRKEMHDEPQTSALVRIF